MALWTTGPVIWRDWNTNKIGAEQKKAAFLACIGKRTYGLLRALTVPGKPADKTYKES